MPHLKRLANWRLEKNPGSDREITPEFTTDRPASHTLTHLTQRILNYIKNNTILYEINNFLTDGFQSVLALIEHHDEKTIWSMKKNPPILRRDMERDNMFSSLLIQNSELLSYDGLWPRRVHKFFLHSADQLEH